MMYIAEDHKRKQEAKRMFFSPCCWDRHIGTVSTGKQLLVSANSNSHLHKGIPTARRNS